MVKFKSKNTKVRKTRKSSMKPKHRKLNKTDDDGVDDVGDILDTVQEETEELLPKWYDEFEYQKFDCVELDEKFVSILRAEAEKILEDEIRILKSRVFDHNKSEALWMMKVAKSGTTSDKIAALTLMVQENPVYNISSLNSLISMAKVSKKQQFVPAIETVVELFLSDLLRPGRKLKWFHKQPLNKLHELCDGDNILRKKRLCYWLFEDQLKNIYYQFVLSLNSAGHDTVPNNREKAIVAMQKLLTGSREQENILMVNLINKLGDPVHKVASKVVYALEKVLHKYPDMKNQMLSEVEKMLFRPHIGQKAQYYGICFLTQFRLSGSDKQIAKNLITLYFSFFKACVKTGSIDSRLMGALLVGVNRAYPYARSKPNETIIPPEHIDTMYKVVHLALFKIGLQALALLMQISNCDRFYNALYKKLLDKELTQTSHQTIWLHLTYKALLKDTNENRVKSFAKRILQICQYFPVPLLCGTLMMLSQVSLKRFPDLFVNNSTTIKEEPNTEHENPSRVNMIDTNADDDEKYIDTKLEDGSEVQLSSNMMKQSKSTPSSWVHLHNLMAKKEPVVEPPKKKVFKPRTSYDPSHRNPSYAGGEHAKFFELLTLKRHFHPSAALFANTILHNEKIRYNNDPLRDFTLIRFLERFSFKNPKKQRPDGEDKEELFRSVGSQRRHYVPKGLRALPVQSDRYLDQSETSIPVDELFLYKYLREKRAKKLEEEEQKKKETGDDDDSDLESVGSEEFNDYLDDLVGKRSTKDLDFAEDIGNTKKLNKGKKKMLEDDDLDKDEEEELSDGEMNEEGEEDLDLDSGSDNFGSEDDISDLDDENMEDEGINDSEEEGIDASEEEGIEDSEEEEQEHRNKDKEDDEISLLDFNNDDDDDIDDVSLDDLSEFEDEDDEEDSKLPLKEAIKKKIGKDFMNMVVPTDKFSEMLEEAGRKKSGGFQDMSNLDNAGEKQLRWEASKIKQNWKSKGKRKWKGNNKNNEKNKKWKR